MIPERDYKVQMDTGIAGAPVLSGAATVTMHRWGDVTGPFDPETQTWPPPDGSVDIPFDLVSILEAFTGQSTAPPIQCVPDAVIDIQDINSVLDAFAGFDMFDTTPCVDPCS